MYDPSLRAAQKISEEVRSFEWMFQNPHPPLTKRQEWALLKTEEENLNEDGRARLRELETSPNTPKSNDGKEG